MTLISLIIVIGGGFNWMSIGLLQYDFIAGFFGTQASIFSRLVYIVVGIATSYLIYDIARNRGKIVLSKRARSRRTRQDDFEDEYTSTRNTQYYNDRDILSD